MCIIIACKSTECIPNNDILTKCFQANSHGAGFMLGYRYSIHVEKGIFDLKEFLTTLEILRSQKLNSPIVIHCRLSTGGQKDKANCHPFKLNKSVGFCHNGILSISPTDKKSDTKILSGLLESIPPKFYQNDSFLKLLDIYCQSDRSYRNKFVFLINKKLHICNEKEGYWNKEKTVWFSNKNWDYKPITKGWNKWNNAKKLVYKKEYKICIRCGGLFEFIPGFDDNMLCEECFFEKYDRI